MVSNFVWFKFTFTGFYRGVEESGRCPKATARVKQDGGVMFAGVAVATSCQIVLPVFGALFLIVGTVLTSQYLQYLSFIYLFFFHLLQVGKEKELRACIFFSSFYWKYSFSKPVSPKKVVFTNFSVGFVRVVCDQHDPPPKNKQSQ